MQLGRTVLLLSLLAGTSAFPTAPARASSSADPGLALVSSHLRTARTVALQGAPLERLIATDPLLHLHDGQPEIELRFAALVPATVDALRALGAIVDHVSYRYGRVLAHADPSLLPALAELPGVTAIHPNYGAQQNSGAVPDQGEAALHTDTARARFGVDGTGSRVGILSDSLAQSLGGTIDGSGCARRLTGASPQFSGDLPAEVVVLDDGPPRERDEGAGLAEIVHDIAPGAGLLFASAYPDEATFAENITALAACGADVLVDDVLFFAEPMFQDGIVAQAAQSAASGGAAVFSAVGNQGGAGVDAVYRDAVPAVDDSANPPTGDDFHDFGGGNRFAAVSVPPRCTLRLVLQWDEPFSGTLGPGASTDLDLYILGAPRPDAVVSGGTDSQGCARNSGGPGGDPLEIAAYVNSSATPRTVYVAVDHFCGRADVRFRLVTFPGDCERYQEFVFDPDVFSAVQVYGHPAAAGVAAVAAVFFGEVDSAGTATPPPGVINVEPFSARGGQVTILYDAQGQPLPGAPVTRFKPDLTAPDGVNTTSFGIDSPYDDDTFPNFFGTSAAAPHAAAVAALLRQAHPMLAPAALLEVLRATARDIEAPGRDVWSGAGLVDAEAALGAVLNTPTPTPTTAIATLVDCNGDGRVTIDELIVGVRIALGETALAACAAADGNGDGHVGIDELVRAVAIVLEG